MTSLYMLISALIIILIVSLFLSKNAFSPINILIVSYLFSLILVVPNYEDWLVDLHPITIKIIMTGIISFFIGYFIIIFLSKNKEKKVAEYEYYKIPTFSKILIILFQILTLYLYFFHVSKIVGGLTLSNFSTAMERYRALSAYSEELITIPGYAVQMSKICNIMYYFVACIFFNNYFYKRKNKEKLAPKELMFLAFNFIIQLLLSITAAGRYTIITLTIGTIILFTIIKSKESKSISSAFKFKDYAKIVVVFLIIIVMFSSLRTVVGRTNTKNMFDYVSTYFGGSVPLLDKYITTKDVSRPELFGYNTFYSVYRMLSKVGFNNSYRSSNFIFLRSGTLSGNVYTSFLVMYNDFGLTGIAVLLFIEGLIWALLFRTVYTKYINNKKSLVLCIIYCIHISSIFLHSFSENFFCKIFSQAFILELIYINVVYFIIYKLKVKMR